MAESIWRLILFAAAVSSVRSQLSPINTRNPAAVVGGQMAMLQRRQSVVEELSKSGRFGEDVFQETFLSEVLPALQNSEMNFSKCAYDVTDFINGLVLRKKHALRMVDSWGKLGSGIATGNMKWLGRYYQCLGVHARNYTGQYFGVVIGDQSPTAFGLGAATTFTLGICLPDSCSSNQTNQLLSPIARELKLPVMAFHLEQPTKYKTTDIIAIIITVCLGLLVVTGTCYDLYLTSTAAKSTNYEPLSDEISRQLIDVEKNKNTVKSRLLLSFSIIKTTRALFDTSQKEGNINSLHGLRFISMTWVMLGHSFIFGPNYIDNQLDAAAYYIDNWHFQAVGNATFSVDSFFFLSGLLATYLGMREMRKRKGKLAVGMPYLYRYLRLTPAYAFCLLISVSLYSKFGDGPMWPSVAEAFRKPCEKYWWTNLIYVNNLYPSSMTDECFGWGWYLANDTQFFLLSPFILALLFKLPLVGNIVLGVGTVFSMAATGGISSHYKEQPQPLQIGLGFSYAIRQVNGENFTSELDAHYEIGNSTTAIPTPPPGPSQVDVFWSDTYAKPWCRMGAYFVGMITGYVLYKSNLRIRMGKAISVIGWAVASATALAIIYGLYGNIKDAAPLSTEVAAFYNAVSRPLWTVCLAWVVVACSSGYGGPVNRFLSWKVFIPLSRLTYCAYLVHPLVIFWAYGNLETMMHFSIVEISLHFLAFVAVSYTIAYVVSVLVEMPMIGITKTFLGKVKSPIPPENGRCLNSTEHNSEA